MIVRLPDGRQLNVQTNDPQAASLAAKKFLAKEQATQMVAKTSPALRATGGALSTFEKAVPFLDEAGAVGPTAKYMLEGNSPGNSWRRARADQDAYAEDYARQHPVVAPLTTGLGYAAQVLPAIMSGGATAEAEAAPVAKGLLGKLADYATKVVPKNATIGGLFAALNGFASDGTLGERLHKANASVLPGMAAGTVLPAGAGLAAEGVDAAASKAAPVVKLAARAVGKGPAPAQTATQKLSAALLSDGATPDQLHAAMNEALKNGATNPTLLDLATKLPNGGQHTLALVKEAASTGPAATVARKYVAKVAADLQDKAIARTQALAPTTRPAPDILKTADEQHRALADEQYGALRNDPIDARPVLAELQRQAGRSAFSTAAKRLDTPSSASQLDQLGVLRDIAHPKPAPVTGADLSADAAPAPDPNAPIPTTVGVLHELKDAFGEMGKDESDTKAAKNHFDSQRVISDYLADNHSGYRAARDAFRQRVAVIDALAHGQTGVSATPEAYSAGLDELRAKAPGPEGAPSLVDAMAQVGHSKALIDAIGAPAEDRLSVLDKLSGATNQNLNLSKTFGPDATDAYQGGLKDLTDQARTASFIKPRTGDVEDELDAGIPTSVHLTSHGIIRAGLKKLAEGAALTDDEREALVQMALDRDDPTQHFQAADEAVQRLPRVFLPGLSTGLGYAGAVQSGDQERPNQ